MNECPKGMSMINDVCQTNSRVTSIGNTGTGGVTGTTRPMRMNPDNSSIKNPLVRDSCMDNCNHLLSSANECVSATSNPGISGCHCSNLTFFSYGDWYQSQQVQCYYSGESYGSCITGCLGSSSRAGGRRAAGTGRRHASGGQIKRRR